MTFIGRAVVGDPIPAPTNYNRIPSTPDAPGVYGLPVGHAERNRKTLNTMLALGTAVIGGAVLIGNILTAPPQPQHPQPTRPAYEQPLNGNQPAHGGFGQPTATPSAHNFGAHNG